MRDSNTSLAKKYLSLAILSTLPGVSSVSASNAEEKLNDFMLEEIIVTAQRRAQSLQDVPMSVSVVDADFMKGSRINTVADVIDYTPGLTGAAPGLLEPKYAIRGISSSEDIGISTSESVGVFMDGSYLGKELSTLAFLDAAQVEVLKGPQGSLFGRNTSAGAISITTNEPSNDKSLDITQSIGRANNSSSPSLETTIIANTPLIEDKLLLRASLLREDMNGFYDNEYLDREVGGIDGWSGSLSLKYIVSDTLEVDFDYMSADRRGRGSANTVTAGNSIVELSNLASLAQSIGSDLGTELGLGTLDPAIDQAFLLDTPANTQAYDNKVSHDVAAQEMIRANLSSVKVTWDINDYNTLTTTVNYGETHAASLSDIDGTPVNLLTLDLDGSGREFSQSFRLNGAAGDWTWLAGTVYYETINKQDSVAFYDDAALLLQSGIAGVLPLSDPFTPYTVCDAMSQFVFSAPACGVGKESSKAAAETEGWGVYGDVTYELTDKAALTFGLRYSVEKKSIEFSSVEADNFYNVYGRAIVGSTWEQAYGAPTDGTIEDDATYRKWTPRFAATYQLTDDVMLFASASTGFKAGGFDPDSVDGSSGEFDEEKNKSYELGVKSQWLDNRLQLNGALYYSDYEGLQVEVNEKGKSITRNVPKVISQGVELDILARPLESLDIIASYAYNDSEFGSFRFENNGQTVDWTDNELPRAPQTTASLIAQYTWAIQDFANLVVRGEGIYTGDHYYTLQNSPQEHQGGYTKYNMRISLNDVTDVWSVSLFGQNLGNKEHSVARTDALGTGAISVRNQPRFWGIEFSYSL